MTITSILQVQKCYFINPADPSRLAVELRKKVAQPEGMNDPTFVASCVNFIGPKFQSQLKPNNAQTQNEAHA